MGAAKSRLRRNSTKRKQTLSQEDMTPKVVLLSGSSYKLSLEFGLTLAEDALSRFKVIVGIPSLSQSDYLGDSRVLEQLQSRNLFVVQMDIESEPSIGNVVREILDTHGLIDGIGKSLVCFMSLSLNLKNSFKGSDWKIPEWLH